MATTPIVPNADPSMTQEPPLQMAQPEPFKYIPDDASLGDLSQNLNPPVEPQAPVEPNFFATYKTKEDAQAGHDEAQRTIATLKQNDETQKRLLQAHNIPITTGTLSQQMKGTQPGFLDTFEQSVRGNNDQPIVNLIEQLVERRMEERFGSMAPVIQYANINRAAEIAATMPTGDPNIPAFIKSESFQDALKAYPHFQQALQLAQTDTKYEKQLPEMFIMAYNLTKGVPSTPQPTRTITPTTSNPPQTLRTTGDAQTELTRPLSTEEREAVKSQPWATIPGIGSV